MPPPRRCNRPPPCRRPCCSTCTKHAPGATRSCSRASAAANRWAATTCCWPCRRSSCSSMETDGSRWTARSCPPGVSSTRWTTGGGRSAIQARGRAGSSRAAGSSTCPTNSPARSSRASSCIVPGNSRPSPGGSGRRWSATVRRAFCSSAPKMVTGRCCAGRPRRTSPRCRAVTVTTGRFRRPAAMRRRAGSSKDCGKRIQAYSSPACSRRWTRSGAGTCTRSTSRAPGRRDCVRM